MYLEEMDYFRPETVPELLALLKEYGSDARILAGGTDLILQMKLKMKKADCLIDVKGIEAFKAVEETEEAFTVGCGVSLTALWQSQTVKEHFPALWDSINVHADRQIRNRGTLIGNLCNASPAADTTAPLLTYSARVTIQSENKTKEVDLASFFTGPGKTILEAGELVTDVRIPKPPKVSFCAFQKLGRVYDDIAIVNASARLEFSEDGRCASASIYMGAVGPVVRRAPKAEELLVGERLTEELIQAATNTAREESSPITDARASAEYRKHTIGVLVERALKDIQEQHSQSGIEV